MRDSAHLAVRLSKIWFGYTNHNVAEASTGSRPLEIPLLFRYDGRASLLIDPHETRCRFSWWS